MKLKKLGSLILAGAVVVSLTACGDSYTSEATADYAAEEAHEYETPMAAGASNAYDGGYMAESWESAAAEEDIEEEEADYSDSKDIDIEEPVEPEPGGESEIDPEESDQKLIYICDVNMETLAYQETMTGIRSLISKYKGIIESENTSDNDYNWYNSDERTGTMSTYMTVRIPTKNYESFVKDLEGTGSKIRSQSQYVQNITRAYNDQSVLVEALQTQETRLMEMMEKAETIEDMIAIEERLTEVQTQLNQAKRALASMDTDIAYSTINLSINEVKVYTPNTHKETFGERVGRGIRESWSGFVSFLQDAVVAVIYFFPFLILLAAIGAVIAFFVRRGTKKRAAKRAAARQMNGFNGAQGQGQTGKTSGPADDGTPGMAGTDENKKHGLFAKKDKP